MAERTSQADRITRVEAQVAELKENYASQLWVTNKVTSIESAMTVMRSTLEEMARRFDTTTTQMADQLRTVFRTQDEILKAKGEQDRQLVEARIELERALGKAQLKILEDKAAQDREDHERERTEREQMRWYNLVKDRYGPLVGLLGGICLLMSAVGAGVMWWIVTAMAAHK